MTLFARGAADGIRSRVVPASALAGAVHAVPVLRRRRDWEVLVSERHFDRYVAARLEPVPLFHGAGGQCLRSLAVARSLGSRTVLDVGTLHVDAFAEAGRRECARFGARFPLHPRLVARMHREYERADLIRVASERARATFLGAGVPSDRVVAINPPLDLVEFPEARFTHEGFRVSFVGALEPWKGFHYLLEAFRGLARKDAELVLWGGPTSRPVSRYLAGRLALDPRVSVRPVDVRKYGYGEVYGKSDVLVHPSLADGYALVVAEAMACGIPVIVTDRTGAADLVRDGENGYVVAAGDPVAIRERLDHLARHPELVKQMGAAARESMQAHSPQLFRSQYVAALRSLLG